MRSWCSSERVERTEAGAVFLCLISEVFTLLFVRRSAVLGRHFHVHHSVLNGRVKQHKSVKFETLKLFLAFFLLALACERIFIKTHSSENRCYRTRKYTVWRRVRASFSPGILQAGTVKWLMCRYASLADIYIPGTCLPASACRMSCETATRF